VHCWLVTPGVIGRMAVSVGRYLGMQRDIETERERERDEGCDVFCSGERTIERSFYTLHVYHTATQLRSPETQHLVVKHRHRHGHKDAYIALAQTTLRNPISAGSLATYTLPTTPSPIPYKTPTSMQHERHGSLEPARGRWRRRSSSCKMRPGLLPVDVPWQHPNKTLDIVQEWKERRALVSCCSRLV
jgi:hypothetical protein